MYSLIVKNVRDGYVYLLCIPHGNTDRARKYLWIYYKLITYKIKIKHFQK